MMGLSYNYISYTFEPFVNPPGSSIFFKAISVPNISIEWTLFRYLALFSLLSFAHFLQIVDISDPLCLTSHYTV